jgi:hypothetical protein
MTLSFNLAVELNTLQKVGFFPYLLPRSVAGETREREQAVIYHQPAIARRTLLLRGLAKRCDRLRSTFSLTPYHYEIGAVE